MYGLRGWTRATPYRGQRRPSTTRFGSGSCESPDNGSHPRHRSTGLRQIADSPASTWSLAEACGVNIGTLAYHFGNKEGLYHAVIDQVYTHILACLSVRPEGTSSLRLVVRSPVKSIEKGSKTGTVFACCARHGQGNGPRARAREVEPAHHAGGGEVAGKLNLPEDRDHRLALLTSTT